MKTPTVWSVKHQDTTNKINGLFGYCPNTSLFPIVFICILTMVVNAAELCIHKKDKEKTAIAYLFMELSFQGLFCEALVP